MENIIANDTNSKDSDGDDDEPEEIHPTLSVSEALKAVETLNVFVQTNFEDDLMKTFLKKFLLPNKSLSKTNSNNRLSKFVTQSSFVYCVCILSLCITVYYVKRRCGTAVKQSRSVQKNGRQERYLWGEQSNLTRKCR